MQVEDFRRSKFNFCKIISDHEVLVLATGNSICVALERAESYVHFSMPNICLSTKSKLDRLILDDSYTIIAERVSDKSLTASLIKEDNVPAFISCDCPPFIGGFLSMMEKRI